jgi:hypothetical protein
VLVGVPLKEYGFEQLRRRELRAALKRTDPTLLEPVLQYLKDDPRTFGSGYVKEIIWKYINRYDLQSDHVRRLEEAALKYLFRPMSREFKLMCQTMARIASQSFWQKVEEQLDSDNPWGQINAYCLFPYSEGITAGEKRRLELNSIRRSFWRYERLEYVTPEELLAKLREKENWIDGVVVEHASPRKAQIIGHVFDEEFQRLDYTAMKSDVVLPKLREVLQTGTLNTWTYGTWSYALHLLARLNDINAVPILIEFLENKVDYKLRDPENIGLGSNALRMLERFGTPEALEAVAKRRQG